MGAYTVFETLKRWQRVTGQIRALVLFGVSQYKPLVLAAFRRLGTHELEKRFNEAALGLQSGAIRNRQLG